jgi:hypothetical protein
MSHLDCESYFDATEADTDVAALLAIGHSRSDFTVVMSDRGQRRYRGHLAPRGLRRGSVLAVAILREPWIPAAQAIIVDDERMTPLVVWGSLAIRFNPDEELPSTTRDLIGVLISEGVARRTAEHLLGDVFRGGILLSVRVRDEREPSTRRIVGGSDERNADLGNCRLSA